MGCMDMASINSIPGMDVSETTISHSGLLRRQTFLAPILAPTD